VTETQPSRKPDLAERLLALRARMKVDPFSDATPSAERSACGASWRAELSRLSGGQSVERWAAAATEWDKLNRPHDAAYCRWRGAQVALGTGQATVAGKLLRRAARDAREHVPLSTAITETASYASTT